MKRTVLSCLLATFTGCGATIPQLRTRASIDLECTDDRLEVKVIDTATRQVQGCGKQAIYVEIFNNSRYPAWMLNSEIHDVHAKSASR
jgi:hypothetical protein